MIKVDIINEVSKAADITKVKAEVAVEAVLDAMKHSIGCCDSGGARLSERTGEKFRRLLKAKRAGRVP